MRVVLVRPRNPLNIGAAARAMSNFGFTDLALVDPYDLAFREAKSAVGAAAVIESAQVFDSVAAAIRDFTLVVGTTGGDRREMSQTLRRLEAGARLMRKHRGAVALLFGSEKSGLSNDDISHCHWLIQIPSRSGHRSMNLGQSVAVCLYELIRDSKAASQKALDKKLAASGELEILHERLSEALERSGYYDHTARRGSANRLRALLRRLHLTAHDAEVWLGIFRQVLWRLKRESDLR